MAAVETECERTRRLALAALERVPAGTIKEDHLPFVQAVLQYLDARQGEAFAADSMAQSFAIANEQLMYFSEFRRLAGRQWDRRGDAITLEEIEGHGGA